MLRDEGDLQRSHGAEISLPPDESREDRRAHVEGFVRRT